MASASVFLLAALSLAQPSPEERPLESWTCTVGEQLDDHVSAMLQTVVRPGGSREPPSFYISWSSQPGYIAKQQMRWVWIPVDASRLWKPDDLTLSLDGDLFEEEGGLVFTTPGRPPIYESARGKVESLRPHFNTTALKIADAYLVARLWDAWPWAVRLSGRTGRELGSQAVLLPGPEAAQASFTRLRAALERAVADPAKACHANFGPTQRELEESQINWGTPIRRPDLTSADPVSAEGPDD